MIKILNYKKSNKYSKNELYDLVHLSLVYAFFILKRFYNLVDLDSSLFNHLYNIDIVIDFNYHMDSLGEYESNNDGDNIIRLPSDLLVEDVVSIKRNKCIKDKILFYIANTIIHEVLHANRDIILNNTPHLYDMLNNNNNKPVFDLVTNYYLGSSSDNSYTNVKSITIMQYMLEESMIEALSRIIMESVNHLNFDKNKICNILLSKDNPEDIRLALKIFKLMSFDTFKWYLLSCYEDNYNNRLLSIFKEDYDDLIKCFASIQESTINNCEYDYNLIKRLDSIIDKRLK